MIPEHPRYYKCSECGHPQHVPEFRAAQIDHMIDQLRDLWHRHSDLRFGQILINSVDQCDTAQIFYAPDDLLLRAIENWPNIQIVHLDSDKN